MGLAVAGMALATANGDLAKPYQRWIDMAPPAFPASIGGIPFTAS